MAEFHREQADWHQESINWWTQELRWYRRGMRTHLMTTLRIASHIAWHTRLRDSHRAAVT